MLRQRGGVADRAGEHGRNGVLVRAQDADDLHARTHIVRIVEEVKARVRRAHVAVRAACGVVLVALGGQDDLEGHIAQVLIAPALDILAVELRAVEHMLHRLHDLVLRAQAERVDHKVRNFVVLVDDEHDLVIILRPGAVDEVVLLVQQVAHELAARAVLRRQHLLPGLHRGVGRAEALEIAAVIAAVELAHAGLQKLRHVGLEDLAVGVLGIDAHAEVIVVGDGADMLGKVVVALQIGFEVLQIVRLRLCRGERAHHVVHDVVGIHGVELVLFAVALVLRMDAHHRTDHAGHVHALSLDGQGVAR